MFTSCCVLVLHEVLVIMSYILFIEINKMPMKMHDDNANLHGHFLVISAEVNCMQESCLPHGETNLNNMLSMSCQPLLHDQDT